MNVQLHSFLCLSKGHVICAVSGKLRLQKQQRAGVVDGVLFSDMIQIPIHEKRLSPAFSSHAPLSHAGRFPRAVRTQRERAHRPGRRAEPQRLVHDNLFLDCERARLAPGHEVATRLVTDGARARAPSHNRRCGNETEDESLQFLTCEERESILFLEQTIDSLEQELEDEDLSLGSSPAAESRSTDPRRSSVPELPSSLKEQDIIDLVQAEPDPARPRGVSFDPISPDFRNMVVSPETHFELKPKCEPAENFPSGYSISPSLSPSGPNEEADPSSHSVHQPAGSIPTPVIIAQKIAAYQGAGDPISPSSILSTHRRNLDSAGGSSFSASVDHLVREGSPTVVVAKPTRYPDNITIQVGSRDYGQLNNRASVNVLHRQAQVLANITGTSSTLETLETKTERKIPTRSISFRDPAPDRSHMEALSKLGLTSSRAISRTNSHLVQVNPPSVSTNKAPVSDIHDSDSKSRTAASSALSFKSETSLHDLNMYSGNPSPARPTASSETNAVSNFEYMNHCDPDNSMSPQLCTKCSLSGFSNSGDKPRVIIPLLKARNDTICNSYDSMSSINLPPLSTTATKTEASLSIINSCGGKTKMMTSTFIQNTATPSSNIVTRISGPTEMMSSSLPATTEAFSIYSSHGENSKAATTSEINANIPRKTIRPASVGLYARSMSFSKEPRTSEISLQTRQSRTSSFHGIPVSSELRWRSFSKPPVFRPQGITVQFSGRGATDESRREALRKLGLLRDTS
ncbi:proline and serine-rich protein 2-like isoform X2 [Scleropages formosus]|uniref:proline and serine-rich protein 2-like isoform X2 n=1 Tax=Scleropages formosus TaxID=113540 RepID=UPI0010FAC8DC|nr:proline and serine-rich protein 2-like isoform X2 [Scleropages formosus]